MLDCCLIHIGLALIRLLFAFASIYVGRSNQIRVMAFMCTTVDTSFTFTKKSKWCDIILVISYFKIDIIKKKIEIKKCGPKLIFFNERQWKDLDIFWHRQLTLNVQISWLLTPLCHLSVTDIKKKPILQCLIYFVKMELVSKCITHKCHNPNLVTKRHTIAQSCLNKPEVSPCCSWNLKGEEDNLRNPIFFLSTR